MALKKRIKSDSVRFHIQIKVQEYELKEKKKKTPESAFGNLFFEILSLTQFHFHIVQVKNTKILLLP